MSSPSDMDIARRVVDRYLKATKTDDEELLEERIGEIADALKEAEDLVTTIEGDPNSDLDEPRKFAEAIRDALQNAETVETEADFDESMRDAMNNAQALGEALKKAKTRVKRELADSDDLLETMPVIDDAMADTKALIRSLRELEPE